MNKLILFAILLLCPSLMCGQWVVTPSGELLNESTRSKYTIIEREGNKETLYKDVLKNVYKTFASPKDVVSTIDNEMIVVRGYGFTTMKYALLNGSLEPLMSIIIEFKDNKMRVSSCWLDVKWVGSSTVDPETFLSKGGLKCFNKKGEVSDQERYDIYNKVSNDLINQVLEKSQEIDW